MPQQKVWNALLEHQFSECITSRYNFPHSLASNVRPLCATATTLAVAPSSFAQQLGQAWGAASFFWKLCTKVCNKYTRNWPAAENLRKALYEFYANKIYCCCWGKKSFTYTYLYSIFIVNAAAAAVFYGPSDNKKTANGKQFKLCPCRELPQ